MSCLHVFIDLFIIVVYSLQFRQDKSNISSLPVQYHSAALLKDLADVEKLLKDVDLLSGLARLLPKGACAGHQAPPVAHNASGSVNGTSWGANATESPAEEKESQAENPHSQFSAFVQLWAGLQPILCGNNRCVCFFLFTCAKKGAFYNKPSDILQDHRARSSEAGEYELARLYQQRAAQSRAFGSPHDYKSQDPLLTHRLTGRQGHTEGKQCLYCVVTVPGAF